jgi:hypothetical protein
MALVSGRPISFKMDLYNPLFVPRPTVEPELFASLRPQSYDGGVVTGWSGDQARSREERMKIESFMKETKDTKKKQESVQARTESRVGQDKVIDKLDEAIREVDNTPRALLQSAKALEMDAPDSGKRMDVSGIQSAASASKLGDYFQYVIKHPVALARQKSAMLPIVGEEIEGTRVSIYNSAVQFKHPLLGVRFKNTTKSHLSQGPVTVIEGSTYAGDARIQDVQPNDERLLAYAIDLGTEVIPQTGDGKNDVTKVSAKKGIVHVTRRQREVQVYKVSNKSDSERTLLIEHPNRTNQQFKLVETAKPAEETAALFRFEVKVAAGKSAEFKVTEERDLGEQMYLTNTNDDGIRFLISLSQSSPVLKANLMEATKKKGEWDAVQRELQQVTADLARITADQDRIRKNLRETPKEAEVYGVYLKKLSEQEKEIDGLTATQKKLTADEATARKGYEEFLLTVAG